MTAISDWLGLRLRLLEGFPVADFHARFGDGIDAVIGPPIARAVSSGVLAREQDIVRLTERGRLMHSEVVVNVIAYFHEQESSSQRSPSSG